MNALLAEKLASRSYGISLYGLAPPKKATAPEELERIVAQQVARLQPMGIDGLVVYDLQDEAARIAEDRPFPFLPTLDPAAYAHGHLERLAAPKIVYRCVNRDTPETLVQWLKEQEARAAPLAVLVGAPSRRVQASVSLADAYALARQHAPRVLLGGIAIAERHGKSGDEHERILAKTAMGCRFFITQAVYDVTSTKSLLSDYALALREKGAAPVPVILTFSPCGSVKTLSFMKWLGIAFPRWLENELRCAENPLAMSLDLCERIFGEIWDYAREKNIPLGVNVESVSIQKREIEASVELFDRLRRRMGASA